MKHTAYKWILLLAASVFVYCTGECQTNDLYFERLSSEHGLSQSLVFCITQDREGFMWFGTEDGLNRYDGYEFRIFQHHDADTNSLSSSNIRSISVDSAGNLWIGTWDAGLNRYDALQGRFIHYRHNPNDPRSLSDDRVVSILPDSNGIIWVSTWGGGLNKYDMNADEFVHYRHRDDDSTTISTDALYTLFKDRSGTLWIGSFLGGLNRFDREGSRFSHFKHSAGNPQSLSDDRITAIHEDPGGNLWVGTWGGGLNRLDRNTGISKTYKYDPLKQNSLSSDIVGSIGEDVEGNLWIGTMGGGLNLYDAKHDEFISYKNHSYKSWTLSNDRVSSFYRDRGNILWFGTGKGINKLDRKRQQFHHRFSDSRDSTSLSGNDVFPIWEDRKGDVWVGTFGNGLNRFERSTGKFKQYHHRKGIESSLSNDRIYALYEDTKGNIWIGTDGGGVDCYSGKSFAHYRFNGNNPYGINNDYIRCITGDTRGNIWIGTQAWGLNCYDPTTGKFAHYRHNPDDSGSLSSDEIQCITVDRSGSLWVGTTKGVLNRFDPEQKKFLRYPGLRNKSDSLSHEVPQVIHEDGEGVLWIGTLGGGLYRFDPGRDSLACYQEKDGLPSEVIYGIVGDRNGALWLSTNNGLSRFSPLSGEFKNYSISNGLQSNEFNFNAYHRGRSGIVYFGGINGYNEFRPELIEENGHVPGLVVTSFQIFGQPISLARMLNEKHELVLGHAQNYFSLEFAALDYSDPPRNQYAYMMEGWNKGWIFPKRGRQATYTNLDPGRYIFRVKGSNDDGVWNSSGISLPVTILPPYWQTWWFRALMVMILSAMLYYMHRYRLFKVLEMEKMRVRIASDLHDDIGSTLTRIVVQSDIIQTMDQTDKVRSTAKQIGTSSREIVATLSDIVWSIDARYDTIGNLIDRMRDFVSDVLSPRQIIFKFEEKGLDMQRRIPVEIRQNLYLIFKEAINNIAKHSEGKHVVTRCQNTEGRFIMTITDDGNGMPIHETSHGLGLRNMKMRAERINGTLEILNSQGVTIILNMKEI